MTTITIKLDQFGRSAEVKGEAKHGSITTHGAGSPNVTHYTVTLAGHEVEGTWGGDARRNTTVRLTEDHPLYAAALKISKAQELLANFRAMCQDHKHVGWTNDDWRDAKWDVRQDYYAAKQQVESDPLAVALLAGEHLAAE